MNILITGNQGYIGSVLSTSLLNDGFNIVGYDVGYYRSCNLILVNDPINQINKDIRDICLEDLENIDVVIHLAALSNDPLGDFDENITYEINHTSTCKIAELSKKLGLKDLFLFQHKVYMEYLIFRRN